MATTLSIKLDRELEMRLTDYMAQTGLTRSQAARELFRQALTDADDITRGWKEGFIAAHAEVKRTMHEASRAKAS